MDGSLRAWFTPHYPSIYIDGFPDWKLVCVCWGGRGVPVWEGLCGGNNVLARLSNQHDAVLCAWCVHVPLIVQSLRPCDCFPQIGSGLRKLFPNMAIGSLAADHFKVRGS